MTTSIELLDFEDTDSELVQYYDVFINGKKIMTTVTYDAEHLREWIGEVLFDNQDNRLRLIVGLDIKLGAPERLSPSSAAEASSGPPLRPVAALLLCTSRTCLVYRLAYASELPRALYRFLSNQNHTFVGVGIQGKLQRLREEYGLGGRTWYNDLGGILGSRFNRPELTQWSVGELRTLLRGSDIERPVVVDIWDDEDLTKEHVHHACIDAYSCYELGNVLVFPVRRGTPD